MPALHEKRLCEVHEGEVQLALRPPRIGEVGVLILSIFIWFDGLKRVRPTRGAANATRRQPRLDV